MASHAGKSKRTKEVLTLKGEIKTVIASVKDGSLDHNNWTVITRR